VADPAPAVLALTVVFGGSGFIGSHVVEALAAEGQKVTAVSRTGKWPWVAKPKNTVLVALDLTDHNDDNALAGLLAEATRVINLAGVLYRPTTPRGTFEGLHIHGTHRIVDALARASTPTCRLVHVSTTGVLGPTGTTPLDEEAPPSPTTAYERTKLEGETLALASRRPHREVTIIRPGLVYGPRDLHLLAWFKAIANGTYRAIANGRALWQPIFVDDVVRGIQSALNVQGADGQTIHLAGSERATIADIGAKIGAALGKNGTRASIPYPLAMAAGAILELAYKPLGTDPPLTRARVRTMTQNRVYAIDRAERLLGFKPEVSLDQGLRRTVAWYRSQGFLP